MRGLLRDLPASWGRPSDCEERWKVNGQVVAVQNRSPGRSPGGAEDRKGRCPTSKLWLVAQAACPSQLKAMAQSLAKSRQDTTQNAAAAQQSTPAPLSTRRAGAAYGATPDGRSAAGACKWSNGVGWSGPSRECGGIETPLDSWPRLKVGGVYLGLLLRRERIRCVLTREGLIIMHTLASNLGMG